jgi:proteasome assembly chaperone (PAC2) family protein
MEHIQVSEIPHLENAVLIGAFSGWNDAASAATWAVKFLINQWEATQFAEIDPEYFFDFTDRRPNVRVSGGNLRRISWPTNRFFAHKAEQTETGSTGRDAILLLGEEPHLHWKAFVREALEVCQACGVTEMTLLGSLVAEVPHTIPVNISGAATQTAMLRRLDAAGIQRAQYEGPTGILSVLQDFARRDGLTTSSLWGTVPHYVSASPNLPVSEALLGAVDGVHHFSLRLNELSRAARRFTQRVSSLVAEDPEVSAYVHELEERVTNGELTVTPEDASGIHRVPVDGELPTPEEAINDVEEWLRHTRGDDDDPLD